MAKASKPKIDFKQLLLNKGEYIVLGGAGLFLVILLISGVSKWTSAKDPKQIANDLTSSAQRVHTKIAGSDINPDDLKATVPPPWIVKPSEFKMVNVKDFPITGPQFDPIAKPDTKKENPTVLPLGAYQVDLIRVPFKAFDIYTDPEGNLKIGVIADKAISKVDEEQRKKIMSNMVKQSSKTRPQQPMNPPPEGPVPGPGGPGGGPIGPGGPGMAGGPGGRMGGGPGRRMGLGNYNSNAQRASEKSLRYIPLEDLDKAMEKGEAPAMTVVPLRGALIHMEVPYKKQIEEVKRALRLPSSADAKNWAIYDGYEVQRRETEIGEDGKEKFTNWADYKYEEQYQELINSRKLADQIEEGYMSYFIRYDMALPLPLPQLVSELGSYPKIRLENITNIINKLRAAGTKAVSPSETVERLKGLGPRRSIYSPQTGDQTGASQIYAGPGGVTGPAPSGKKASGTEGPQLQYKPGSADPSSANAATPDDVDYLLLRFIDVNVEPGKTYEYRIRLRMLNPNFGKKNEVTNPAYADTEVLFGPWTLINQPITIPPEQYMYAADNVKYREAVERNYPREIERKRLQLQLKDDQAVVEICRWLAEVRVDAGKREPVGAWVVADIPVGRGEYIGRKQYIKLPLWSSENKAYILREINTTAKTTVTQQHPKGWMVDFANGPLDILVDFEGGRVKTPSSKVIVEDVATELLVLSSDGKLSVRKSLVDENDPERKQIVNVWTKWVADVENRKTTEAAAEGNPSNLAPRPPMQ